MDTLEKGKIDYKIQAKRKAFNEELKEWAKAAWIVVLIFIVFFLIGGC